MADSKTLHIKPGLLLPSSIPKDRDPNSAKTVQKKFGLELTWTQPDEDPQGSTAPSCCAPSLDPIHTDCAASQKLTRLTTETHIQENYTIKSSIQVLNQLPLKALQESFCVNKLDKNNSKNTAIKIQE